MISGQDGTAHCSAQTGAAQEVDNISKPPVLEPVKGGPV